MTESELLFTEVLNCSRDRLYLDKDRILTQEESCFLANALKRRFQGEPIQYILGKTEFMGLEFKLTPDVFIPRPETEILVETAVQRIVRSPQSVVRSILDVGTGSGCIAISMGKFLKDIQVTASDISNKALEVAKENALLNNVEINFLQSDLFFNPQLRTRDYGLIVSNPPYIPRAEINNLQPELSCEPRIALDGGRDGLDFYRRIINAASLYLKRGGFLIIEMGFGQCPAIKGLFNSVQEFKILNVLKDYQDVDRVIVAQVRTQDRGREREKENG